MSHTSHTIADDSLTTAERFARRTSGANAVSAEYHERIHAHMDERQIDTSLRLPYERLLSHLTLSPWKADGGIVMPSEKVAECWDQTAQWSNNNFHSAPHLHDFGRALGIGMEIQAHDWYNNRCRRINKLQLPKALRPTIEAELSLDWHRDGLVSLWDGSKLSPRKRTEQRERMEADANSHLPECKCETARRCMVYLNSVKSNRYALNADNWDAVRQDILSNSSGRAQAQALRVLSNIKAQPVPYYRPTAKSVRLFGTSENLTMLSKKYRQQLYPTWIDADLRSCYLAVAARLWDVPIAHQYLEREGESVWTQLLNALGVEHTPDNKGSLKSAFYGLFFFLGAKKLRTHLKKSFGATAYDDFMSHPLIVELHAARQRQYQAIRKQGYGVDLYGECLEVRGDNIRSIMAQQMQCYELELLEPVFSLAEEFRDNSRGFSVTLMQHDGLSFVPHRIQETQQWKERLSRAVARRADNLGVSTYLTFD